MPGLRNGPKAKGGPMNLTKSGSQNAAEEKITKGRSKSLGKIWGPAETSTTRTIIVRNCGTQKPSLKSLSIAKSGTTFPTPPRRENNHLEKAEAVISTTSIMLPTPASNEANKKTEIAGNDMNDGANNVYKALVASRSFAIIGGKSKLTENDSQTRETTPRLSTPSLGGLKHRPTETCGHRSRQCANVSIGGLDVQRKRFQSLSHRDQIGSPKKAVLKPRISDQSLGRRRAVEMDPIYKPDPRLKLCGIKTSEPSRQLLIESGKRILQKFRRMSSTGLISNLIPPEPSITDKETCKPEPVDLLNEKEAYISTEESSSVYEVSTGTPVSRTSSFEASQQEKLPANFHRNIETEEKRLPLDLATIEIKAATIKHVMDPLTLCEEGILSQIRNPNDDITAKTLSKLLGEEMPTSLKLLKDKIRQKVSKSRNLISPRQSMTSLSTSVSSNDPQVECCRNEDTEGTPNGIKGSKRKKVRKKGRKKRPKKARGFEQLNHELDRMSNADTQLQACLQRQQSLEAQVASFVADMRERLKSVQNSFTAETLVTLESLVKTQTEVISMQKDLKQRYGVIPTPSQDSKISLASRIDQEERESKEPILNAFNLDYGRLACYARETEGRIEFYCPTCKVGFENEMTFRLHLEGIDHVARAHKELKGSQPWYSCEECKTHVQGTTQYLKHVIEKKHVDGQLTKNSAANRVLESKKSFVYHSKHVR